MWSRRGRRSAPPVILPSLDRLSALIERVVELVDAVGGTSVPSPEPVPEPPREPAAEQEPAPAERTGAVGWLAFVPSPHGYRLLEQEAPLPAPGHVVELAEGRFRVLRLARSPLPGDRRECAYLEREERPEEDRSFDA